MDKEFKRKAINAMIKSVGSEINDLPKKFINARCMFPEEYDLAILKMNIHNLNELTLEDWKTFLNIVLRYLEDMIEDIDERACSFNFFSEEDLCMWFVDTFQMKCTKPKITKVVNIYGGMKMHFQHWFKSQEDFDSDWLKSTNICKIMLGNHFYDWHVMKIMQTNFGWR